jgi:hypothetical protein
MATHTHTQMIAQVAEDTHGTLLELGSIYAIRMICSKSETQR